MAFVKALVVDTASLYSSRKVFFFEDNRGAVCLEVPYEEHKLRLIVFKQIICCVQALVSQSDLPTFALCRWKVPR
eukprot:3878697-Ditylum_brightwellii.AAC.1